MSAEEFRVVCSKIRPFTDYIYLHVLGEPLLHPHFEEMLQIAAEQGLHVNITTNAGLLDRKKDILLRNDVRQINISLHDAEENVVEAKWGDYLNSVFDYAEQAASKTYVNLRLWNSGVATSTPFNQFCLAQIAERFKTDVAQMEIGTKTSGIKLADHVFLQHAARFEWPDGEIERTSEVKTCYALRDQIAILAEGTVVPCCLDADANMNLGNIFNDDLLGMLNSERALRIRNGFINNRITEEFCKSCGFFI